jgi:hypothetical protein
MKRTIQFTAVIALALGVACAFGLGQAQAADYAGSSQCKVCHNKKDEGAQYDAWKSMTHSKAFETLKSPEAIKIGEEKGLEKPPAESPECIKCHVTAYDAAAKAVPDKIKLEDSVSCEQCHGPGSDHIVEGKKVMFQKDTTIDMAATQAEITAETCTKCHNEESPTWNPERYTLEDGTKVGFDFELAKEKIDHSNPKKAEGG